MMKIRMRIQVSGTFHGNVDGVNVGDVVELEDVEGERYVKLGYADQVHERKGPEQKSDDAVASPESEQVPKPLVPPKPVYGETHPPEAGVQATKRRPGRPARKAAPK